jgi:Uma2 family endonuclease
MMTTATRYGPALAPPGAYMRRFTVSEYDRMIDIGILTEEDPVELLEGWVTYKMPRTPRHDLRIELARRAIDRVLPDTWCSRDQKGIRLSESAPEPDVAVVLGPPVRYDDHHPGPSEIGLIVEVANTTLDLDRTTKCRIYAHDSIPSYWIINLIDQQVEVYTDPTGPGPSATYRQRKDYRSGDAVLLVLGGQTIGTLNVPDLLP